MRKIAAIFGVFVTLLMSGIFAPFVLPSIAGVTCSLPFNLTNGTTADASQVMANYNALVTCLTNAAAAGANNDITSLSGLTTPLTPTQGGSNVYIGSTPTVSGAELIIASTTPANFANTKGYSVIFAATATNAGATTINVNGQGIVNLYKQSTAGPVPLTGSELFPNQLYMATFDGTEFQINPVPSVAAGWGLSQNASATALQINTTNPPYGFGPCVNLQLNASVLSNLLTVSAVAADVATTASINHPILCSFRDSTIANGDPAWLAITGPLSINTNATGATLGSVNNTPFRFWVEIFNNSGTPVLGLFNASTVTPTTQIFPIDEGTPQSTIAISAASTNPGTYYTPNGTTLSSKSFRILGYLEYASGLTTAGTYASTPTKIQLFGPGTKKPGDVIQKAAANFSSLQNATNAFTASGIAQTVTPTSTINLIYATATVNAGISGGHIGTYSLGRAGPTLFGSNIALGASGAFAVSGMDAPNTTSAVPYAVYFKADVNSDAGINPTAGNVSAITVEELMD